MNLISNTFPLPPFVRTVFVMFVSNKASKLQALYRPGRTTYFDLRKIRVSNLQVFPNSLIILMYIYTFAGQPKLLSIMKMRKTLILFTLITLLSACNSSKQISSSIDSGKSAYQSGNYGNALQQFEEVIAYYEKKYQQKECPVYGDAAYAAKQLGETDKAIGYFKKEQRSNFADANTYFQLALMYREIDNLSNELDELEAYVNKFPEGEKLEEVESRLFEVYIESENWEKVLTLWNMLRADDQEKMNILEGYFVANKALDNDSICDVLATNLLEKSENNLVGLDWLGKKYFWRAEYRYQDELEAYEKNKTNKQYKRLLKALDVVSADFKTSLRYFKKLYKMEPKPTTAKYIGNIYNRLDDKKKADYYYGLAK